MKRAIRCQKKALDRLLKKRAEAAQTGSPQEYLRRMPIREGPPCPPIHAPDEHVLRRFRRRARRWFVAESQVVSAAGAGQADLTVIIGSPVQVLAAIERVEHATCRAVRDLWPSFRCTVVGGVDLAPFAEALRLRTGPGIVRIEAIQPAPGITMALDGRFVPEKQVYFEFVPEEGGPACGLAQVDSGCDYRVLVTDGVDHWRYDGGEVVRFDSRRVERVRNRFDVGSFGERLAPGDVEGARGSAAAFRLVPEYPTAKVPSGRYVIEAQFDSVPPDLGQEARRIDAALMEANEGYRWLREEAVLRPPMLRLQHRA